MAYSPNRIVLEESHAQDYISDGTTPLDMIAWVLDLANATITAGTLTCSEAVKRNHLLLLLLVWCHC